MKTGPVLAALATFIFCFVWLAPSGYLSRAYKFSRGYGETTGVITARIPNSHGTVLVKYSVAGVAFEGALGASPLEAGNSIKVYYSSEDPGVSQLVKPSIVDGLGVLLILFSLAAALVAGFAVRRAYGSCARSYTSGFGTLRPRLYCLLVAAGVAVSNFAARPPLLVMALAVPGCVLLVYASWGGDPSWRDLIRRRASWAALILLLSASFV